MNEEGFEEWDADFLDQLIQVEELALSSSSSSSKLNPNPLPSTTFLYFPQSQQQQQQQQQKQYHHHHPDSCISYSPPRELSQRPFHVDNNKFDPFPKPNSCSSITPPISLHQDDAKDQEIERLKRELGRVSKQLSNLERECCELRNGRNKKEEQLKCVYSHIAEEDKSADFLKNKKLKSGPAPNIHGIPQPLRNAKALESEIGYQICLASSFKDVGIQTEKTIESSNLELNDAFLSRSNVSDKLLGIWNPASDQASGRYLVSKLFTACPGEFHFLFGRMSINISKISGTSVPCEGSSNAALQNHLRSFHSSEAPIVSRLYSILTEIANGLLQSEFLLEPLIELCYLENVDILCRSLSILRAFLKHLLNSGRTLEERDSVKIEGATSLCSGGEEEASCARYLLLGTKSSSDSQILSKKGIWNLDNGLPSCVNWFSLFNLLHRIAVSSEECARLEAVSTMNVILLRTNAYEEREIFGQAPIFESIAHFLKKEARSHVQKEALHLLYLLLNCPRLLNVFCSGCKDGDTAENDDKNDSTCKRFSAILEGLADCIGGRGNSIQDVELRKRAVVMLAFLASSGKFGFEILVKQKLPGGKSFLMLILQLLMSEMNVEVSVSSEPAESIKARTLLMREALILLNRIVSNPGYSAIVLRTLTASRDMASMIIDIVSRLSRKDQILTPSDYITRQMRESEIVDLARVLKKRVFTYLGDKIT